MFPPLKPDHKYVSAFIAQLLCMNSVWQVSFHSVHLVSMAVHMVFIRVLLTINDMEYLIIELVDVQCSLRKCLLKFLTLLLGCFFFLFIVESQELFVCPGQKFTTRYVFCKCVC